MTLSEVGEAALRVLRALAAKSPCSCSRPATTPSTLLEEKTREIMSRWGSRENGCSRAWPANKECRGQGARSIGSSGDNREQGEQSIGCCVLQGAGSIFTSFGVNSSRSPSISSDSSGSV